MAGPWLLSALSYLGVLVFVVGVALRALKYARAPMHLRWELYPVPHEKGKGYGGSYFEEPDWWTRPRKTNPLGEIRAMLEEILLIRSLWHRNRAQWYASFPFHVGLYLLAGLLALLLLGAAAQALGLAGLAPRGSPLRAGLQVATVAVGALGLLSATAGCLALLYRRLFDPDLRAASTLADYRHLGVLLAVLLGAAYAWLAVDSSFDLLRGQLLGLITLSPRAAHPAVALEVALGSVFLLYLPFTHMTHFVAKYFTYHQVRWDDAPAMGDPRTRARMASNLARPVGWAGPHIQPEKSWAEAAMEVK